MQSVVKNILSFPIKIRLFLLFLVKSFVLPWFLRIFVCGFNE